MKANLIRYFLLAFFCFLSAQSLDAQALKTIKAIRTLRVAQDYIRQGKLAEAKTELELTIKIKNDFAIAYRELGRVNLDLANYQEAIDAFEKSFALDPALSRAAYFECGEAYFKLSRFDTAATYFSQYEVLKDGKYTNAKREASIEAAHNEKSAVRTQNYLFAIEAVNKPTLGLGEGPFNVGSSINSKSDEYMPTISGDGQVLLYTTTQTTSPVGLQTGENVFISKKVNKQWTQGVSFSPFINTDFNEGQVKFAADERYIYYTGCMRDDSKGGCDLYQVRLDNLDVVEVKPLIGYVNSNYWESQPSISCEGIVIYFSSTREGGYGGADIWRSYLKTDGTWSNAENLGPRINTAGDEESPFISADGVTLYFASDGHAGMGESDIFMSRLERVNNTDWKWSPPYNLGYPINTPFREVGLFVKPDGKTAYYASARLDGFGGLDIFEFTLPLQFQPFDMVFIEGQIKDEFTQEPLEVSLDIMRNGKKWELQTDKEGWYFMCLPTKKAYAFQINDPNYEYFMEAAFLPAQDNAIPFRFDISLIPKKRRYEVAPIGPTEINFDILFSFDNFALDDKARGELKELVTKLETESGWEVEVIGYTDGTGSLAYNQMLSEQRAKAVVTYLSNAGIKVKSIRQEGRGAVSYGDKENNRRVEVIIRK